MFKFVGHKSSEPALILLEKDGEEITYTWRDYHTEALKAANGLSLKGVKSGDFIAIIALNLPESFFVLLGTILLGAVPVPINVPLIKEPGQKDLKAILNDCQPKLVLTNQCLSQYLPDINHRTFEEIIQADVFAFPKWKLQDDELLIMPYTSGTTGGPKGVMLNYGNITNRVEAITNELKISSSERLLSYLSLGHISELIATFFGQLKNGYRVYFTEYAVEVVRDREKFRQAFPSVLQTVKPTVFLAVPKVWINFRKEIEGKIKYIPIDLGKRGFLRDRIVKHIKKRLGFNETKHFISAGSKLSLEDGHFFSCIDIYIDDIYGQTETAGPLTFNGKPIGDTSVMMGRDNEILVKGPNVMLGYFNKPEANKKVLENGVFHTGDVGIWPQVDDFCFQVLYGGRLGDGYKNAQGEFVSPEKIEELEEAVRKIDGVDEVIVCGENKPYNIALVFSSKPSRQLHQKLEAEITKIGQGMYKIKKFLLIDSKELELTPTLKVRRKAMLKKFEKEINKL